MKNKVMLLAFISTAQPDCAPAITDKTILEKSN